MNSRVCLVNGACSPSLPLSGGAGARMTVSVRPIAAEQDVVQKAAKDGGREDLSAHDLTAGVQCCHGRPETELH
jgi:hypothetical protein